MSLIDFRAIFFAYSYHEKLDDIDTGRIDIEYMETMTYWLNKTRIPLKHKELF